MESSSGPTLAGNICQGGGDGKKMTVIQIPGRQVAARTVVVAVVAGAAVCTS